ncbi:MAG: hypothetical protein LWX08_10915 [Deltaproteobacteria bacterium]|nr:hypothetical protein [Deltaproteobacteria bacterium]
MPLRGTVTENNLSIISRGKNHGLFFYRPCTGDSQVYLSTSYIPVTYQQMWEAGKVAGITGKVKTKGKTPWHTLGAQMYVDVRDNPNSDFVKVSKRPARFFLKNRQSELTDAFLQKIDIEEAKKPEPKTAYQERDLHPLVSYFAYAGYQLKAGHFPPFWLYGNSTIKQNLRNC